MAVKIAHPSIREWIERDLLVIDFMAKMVDAIVPGAKWMGLPEQAALFADMMRQQLDLRYEAYTLHRFSRNFQVVQAVHWVSNGLSSHRGYPHRDAADRMAR